MIDLLFRHLFESTVLCLLFGSLAYGLQRQAAAVRHSMWLISVLKFSIPTVLLSATGAWMAFILPATAWMSSIATRFSALLARLFGFLPTHINAGNGRFASLALVTVWALGSALMFGIWFNRLRKSREGLSAASNREETALDRAKRRLGFHGAVAVRSSGAGEGPVSVGILRTLITIPTDLSEHLTEAEFQAVLLHELAHACRRDNLVSAFVHGLVCLFWFHPLLWFVEKQLIVERERACDEMVIDCGISPEIYLAGLVKACKFQVFGGTAGVSAAGGSDLLIRFDHILSYRGSHPIPCAARLVVAGLAVFMALLPVAGGYCRQCVSNGQGMTSTSINERP